MLAICLITLCSFAGPVFGCSGNLRTGIVVPFTLGLQPSGIDNFQVPGSFPGSIVVFKTMAKDAPALLSVPMLAGDDAEAACAIIITCVAQPSPNSADSKVKLGSSHRYLVGRESKSSTSQSNGLSRYSKQAGNLGIGPIWVLAEDLAIGVRRNSHGSHDITDRGNASTWQA